MSRTHHRDLTQLYLPTNAYYKLSNWATIRKIPSDQAYDIIRSVLVRQSRKGGRA